MQGSGTLVKGEGIDLTRAKNWWAQCQAEHGQGCQVPLKHRYPGREVAGHLLRLLDVNQKRVVAAPAGSSYVALSYVWPRTKNLFKAEQQHFQRPRTTPIMTPLRDDETAYFDVPMDRLPKTIQDAMRITHEIGEKYLWIDALCIIQDDMIDVQRTIYKMDEIYMAASLTIVMGDRKGAVLEGGRPNVHQIKEQLGDTTYVLPLPPISEAINRSVWGSRGWTYQGEKSL
ncbi:HET-domain-containing protein [Thozetella sp. PMI_491]|nr:HET-domain-containing protein [Thozetella sp. PMI_491]